MRVLLPLQMRSPRNCSRRVLRLFGAPADTDRLAVSRDLPKIGLYFMILNPAQFNADIFAGICIANGCGYDTAKGHARGLNAHGSLRTTIRPLANPEQFRAACEMVGVRVEDIPPL